MSVSILGPVSRPYQIYCLRAQQHAVVANSIDESDSRQNIAPTAGWSDFRWAGRGLMMVGEGGATGEGGGASPSGSGFLQSVGVVGRAAHSGVAAATCGGGRAGGTCGGLRRIELQRFDPSARRPKALAFCFGRVDFALPA